MPPFNMDRKHAKREMERAIGNIAWCAQHLDAVKSGFIDGAAAYAEINADIPDSYVETISAIDEIIAALIMVGETIKKVDETI